MEVIGHFLFQPLKDIATLDVNNTSFPIHIPCLAISHYPTLGIHKNVPNPVYLVSPSGIHSFTMSFTRSFSCGKIRRVDTKLSVYTELKYMLSNNPVNIDTQKKMEEFLLLNGVHDVDMQVGGVHIGIYSKNIAKFLHKYNTIITHKMKQFIKTCTY